MLDENVQKMSRRVIGAAIEVHRILGPGYVEKVYEEALEKEFLIRQIPYERQKPVSVNYKNFKIGEGQMDFLISETLVLELKAVDTILPVHIAQVISYLKTTDLTLGLLINFNVPLLRQGVKRIING